MLSLAMADGQGTADGDENLRGEVVLVSDSCRSRRV